MLRNARPEWIGTGGRFESEWMAGLGRNTHSLPTSVLANNKDCFHKGSYQLTGATFFDRKINGWEFG
jgi:hypothetical protein